MRLHQTQGTSLRRGRVISGRGLASLHLAEHKSELQDLTGTTLSAGSLNVVLRRPLGLRRSTAVSIDEGRRRFWQASVAGTTVWIYRYGGIPTHIIELVAAQNLRTALGLQDGDEIQVSLRSEDVVPVSVSHLLAWSVFWLGRRNRYYTSDGYASRVATVHHVAKTILTRPIHAIRRLAQIARDRLIAFSLRKLAPPKATPPFNRISLDDTNAESDRSVRQLINVLNYTKTSGTSYAATAYPAGYQTITLGDTILQGQRDPKQRLESVPFEFQGKSVLDLGCNQGGMLFAIEPSLSWGVGVDFDARMINAANRIRSLRRAEKLDFYVLDLENEPLDLLSDLLRQERVDIVFLLSVCMWIENWREVIDFATRVSDRMLFESNGAPDEQWAQVAYLDSVYADVVMLASESEDDPGQKNRQLYLCSGPTG